MKPDFLFAFVFFLTISIVQAGTGPGGNEKSVPVPAKPMALNPDSVSTKISVPVNIPESVNAKGKIPRVTFCVQLYASKKPCDIKSKKFRDIPNVKEYRDGNMYIYYSGSFLSYYDALNVQKMINEYCFNDAFVIAFEEDKKVDVNYALSKVVSWWSK